MSYAASQPLSKLALLRGAGLAVALCWAREHEMDHMLSGALIGRVGPLLLVVAANLAVCAAEFVIASAWLVWRLWHSRASLWDGIGVLVFPVAAVLPLLSSFLPGSDGERNYLGRHRAELERAVLTGEGPDDWEVWKDGERTILRIGPWGITDSYFLIHDPNPGGELSEVEFTTYSFQLYRRSIRHVEGPWHSVSM